MVLLLTLLEDEHSLCDFDTLAWWVCEGLELLDGLDLKTVDGLCGPLHSWYSLSELNISSCLLFLSSISNLNSLLLLNGGGFCLLSGISTLPGDNFNELVSLLLFNSDINHLNLEGFLEGRDLVGGTLHGVETNFETINLVSNLLGLLTLKIFVELDQLEVRSWSGVIMTSLLNQEIFVGFTDR